MKRGQHPSLATLLAWNDGEIDGRSAAAITEHVSDCVECRARLDEAMSLHALLRDLPQITIAPGDPGIARARALAYERPRRRQTRWQPLLLAMVVLVGVSLLVFTIRPTSSDAGMGISAVVRLLARHEPDRAPEAVGPPGDAIPTVSGTIIPGIDIPAGVVAPAVLPLGLQRVEVTTLGDAIGVTYASSTGLQVQLAQEVADGPLDVTLRQSTQVVIQNVAVLLSIDTRERVSLAIWDVGDVRFQMFTLAEPPGGLTGPMTTEIISALLSSEPAP